MHTSTEENHEETASSERVSTRSRQGYMEEIPVEEITSEEGTNSNTKHGKSTSYMNWGDFINALPTLLSFPASSTARPSAEDKSTHDTHSKEFSFDLSHHHHKATTEITDYEQENIIAEYSAVEYDDNYDLSNNKPTISSSTETEQEQYDYIVSYDELDQAIKKLKDPVGGKARRKFRARNVLLAIVNTGRRKLDDRIYKIYMILLCTTARTPQLPAHYQLRSECRLQTEESTFSKKQRPNFCDAPLETSWSSTFQEKSSTAQLQLWSTPSIPTANLPKLQTEYPRQLRNAQRRK